MNREITGIIKKSDGSAWSDAVVTFELERSSYDESAQYPVQPVRSISDEDGQILANLWINENALQPTRYICTLPDGSQFRFTLTSGNVAADLNDLRENSVEDESPLKNRLAAFLPIMRNEVKNATASLNETISTLHEAIVQAQETLHALIDQKADVIHAHGEMDITGGTAKGLAFFDTDGNLTSSPKLVFVNGRLGLGTSEPAHTIDFGSTNFSPGKGSRLVAKLNSSEAIIRIISNPDNPHSAGIRFFCGSSDTQISTNVTGHLEVGSLTHTPAIKFLTTGGETYCRNFVSGEGEATENHFPENNSFGFYKDINEERLSLVFNDGGIIKHISFERDDKAEE
jgi:hypothetical protein